MEYGKEEDLMSVTYMRGNMSMIRSVDMENLYGKVVGYLHIFLDCIDRLHLLILLHDLLPSMAFQHSLCH